MEIPLINTITGFEAGITHLQDPSFFARLLHLSQSVKFYSFWTWCALLLATIATFSSVLHRSIIALLLRFRIQNSPSSDPSIRFDTDPDEETSSISSESESENPPSTSEPSNYLGDEDFRVSGSNKLKKDRTFNRLQGFCEEDVDDFFSGGVVKLWSDLGLGFERSSGLISMWDLNRGEILRSFLGGKGQIPALAMPSPAVVISAGVENMRNAALRIWDARAGSQSPAAAVAEWQPRRRRVVGVDSGRGEKVYVTELGGSVVLRDMRNVTVPLEEITESAGQTWFDADAVIVDEGEGLEFDRELGEKGEEPSVVSRCRNAMWSCLF